MKNTISASRRPEKLSVTSSAQPDLPEDEDRATRFAFYFLMATMGAALLYLLLLPFIL